MAGFSLMNHLNNLPNFLPPATSYQYLTRDLPYSVVMWRRELLVNQLPFPNTLPTNTFLPT